MTMFLAPYTAIADIDGSPLDAGFIFFGEFGKNPESFPIPIYWDADFTIPAAQPIRTRNGYPIRNGSPCKIYLKQAEHSLVIKNKNLSAILVEMNNKGISSSLLVRPNGQSVETSLSDIYSDLSNKQQQIDEKPSQQYLDGQLSTKAPQATTYTKLEVDSALSAKAPQETTYTKLETDVKFSAYVGGRKGFTTLALAQAGQSTLTANTVVDVTNDPDPAKNGTYQWNGTTLTKSAYDPLTQAKADATAKANAAEANAKADATTKANAAEANAKAYTDSQKSDTLNQMQEAIDGIDKSILLSDIKGEADVTGEVVYGEYYTSSGATATYANTVRTAKIKLDPITDIWVTQNNGGLGALRTVFYDSNYAFISAHATIPNDTPTKLTIPVGAVYVGVSGSSQYPLSVVKKSSVDGVTIAGMQGAIDSLEDGFGSISAAVKETAIPFDTNGYYWNDTTGLLVPNASFKASAKTPIPSNSLLVINGDFDTRAGGQVLFFDSNGALVPSNFVRKLSYDNYLLAPPVTATHVAISTGATFNTSVTLKGDILVGFGDINSTYAAVKSGVNSNAKTVRANNFYDLGNNYAAIKSQRARSNYGILFAGQSNMDGMAAHSQLSTLGLPETLAINNWTGAAFTAPQTVASGTKWGIWWSLLKRLKDYKPTTNIYSYKLAQGGSTMHTNWNPAKQGVLFDSFLVNIDKIKKLDLVNIKVCVWWQGESDSVSPHAENYEQRLKDFINAVRGAANDPLLPFVVLGIHKNTGSWYSPVVRAAQIRASIDMPNVYFVDVDDVPYTTAVGEGGHYDGVFFEAVAPRVFDIIKDL